MDKRIRWGTIAVLVASLWLGGPLFALAKERQEGAGPTPAGFEKGEKKGWQESEVPPGWGQGEKTGWGDREMPPGLAKKSDESTPGKAKGKHKKKGKKGGRR